MAASSRPSNPLVSLAVTGAGLAAAFVANQALERGWSALFGEPAPTDKASKQSAKEVKAERKQAKHDGASRTQLQQITDPMDEIPLWKMLLWAALSGVAIQGLRLLAERGTERGAQRLLARRPETNRG